MLDKHFILHLTLLEDIGPGAIQRIMQPQRSDVHASDLYAFTSADWMRVFGFTDITAQKIATGLADTKILERELNLIEEHNVNWMAITDEIYPQLLREIYLPPMVLYWRGQGSFLNPSILFEDKKLRANGEGEASNEKKMLDSGGLDKSCDILFSARPECAEGVYRRVAQPKCFAVVGARKANDYGQRAVDALVPDLVAAGYTIVSGGALGIDTMAHEATLKCGGKTVAILGSGLLRPYPSSNKKLFTAIVDSGGIVASSYPLMMEPFPGNFPARNRIVTGLSRGCLVVQAAQKSGALISAHCALEQGREVFAVPGLFDDELSAGCNELIQQGAKLVMNSADILQEFGDRIVLLDKRVMEQKALQMSIDLTPSILFEDKKLPTSPRFLRTGTANGKEALALSSTHSVSPPLVLSLSKDISERSFVYEKYSPAQQQILRICKNATSLDDIIAATQLPFELIQSELFNLQLDGVISQDFTGMWVAE